MKLSKSQSFDFSSVQSSFPTKIKAHIFLNERLPQLVFWIEPIAVESLTQVDSHQLFFRSKIRFGGVVKSEVSKQMVINSKN